MMIHAALSSHHCTGERIVYNDRLFEQNGQLDLGATGSETLENVYSDLSTC